MGQVFAKPSEDTEVDSGEVSGGVKDSHSSGIEPPLSLYQKDKGTPYSVKFFNIKEYDELSGLLDVDKMIDKVGSIEKFIKDYIKEHNFEDTTESYDYIIKDIFNKLKINEHETTISKLKKVTNYIKMLSKGKSKYA
jgi:hypothetical protein